MWPSELAPEIEMFTKMVIKEPKAKRESISGHLVNQPTNLTDNQPSNEPPHRDLKHEIVDGVEFDVSNCSFALEKFHDKK